MTEVLEMELNFLYSVFLFTLVILVLVSCCGSKNICTNLRYSTGEWKHRNVKEKSFHCCPFDDLQHNISICGTDKRDLIFFIGSDDHPARDVHGCQCDRESNNYNTVSARESYVWVPDFCDLLPFNGTQYCELLGNRRVLFVGDSTMDQTATTLMSMIHASGGKCVHQLSQGRSDLLYVRTKYTFPIQDYLKNDTDIVILTAGAHLNDEGDMWSVLENFKNMMKNGLAEKYPNIKWVWKTQNPGHVDCKQFTAPLKNYSVDPSHTAYNYHLFPRFDEIARMFMSQEPQLKLKVIDMSMLYLRPDAHADCMHLCIPGPLDVFSNIMLTMLYTGEL